MANNQKDASSVTGFNGKSENISRIVLYGSFIIIIVVADVVIIIIITTMIIGRAPCARQYSASTPACPWHSLLSLQPRISMATYPLKYISIDTLAVSMLHYGKSLRQQNNICMVGLTVNSHEYSPLFLLKMFEAYVNEFTEPYK